mgnify:CR=1 FL=1|jgi:hypothetical protein
MCDKGLDMLKPLSCVQLAKRWGLSNDEIALVDDDGANVEVRSQPSRRLKRTLAGTL